MLPDSPLDNSKQFFRSTLSLQDALTFYRFEKRFSKNPQCVLEKLSVVVHIPMPTPKSCKTFRFENDSLKKTECCPMLPGKTRNSFFVRRCRVEWNENGSFLKNAFLKITNASCNSSKLSFIVHTQMPNPKSCNTFSFVNDYIT